MDLATSKVYLHFMAFECERKFLIANEDWRRHCVAAVRIRDGLLFTEDGRKMRVRILGDKATLTFKSKRTGALRDEFEYQIPMADAEAMLARHCADRLLTKTRHDVVHDGRLWLVDVYHDRLEGVVLAETDVAQPSHPLLLPDWIGREVTDDPRFHKTTLWRDGIQLN